MSSAFDSALRLLAARARTEVKLRERLAQGGHSEGDIDSAVARLKALGYLDDAAYAENRVRHWMEEGRVAPPSFQARLEREGVTEALALGAPPFDVPRARALLERRKLWSPPWNSKSYARAARWLLGQGYAEDQVELVLGAFEVGGE